MPNDLYVATIENVGTIRLVNKRMRVLCTRLYQHACKWRCDQFLTFFTSNTRTSALRSVYVKCNDCNYCNGNYMQHTLRRTFSNRIQILELVAFDDADVQFGTHFRIGSHLVYNYIAIVKARKINDYSWYIAVEHVDPEDSLEEYFD